MPKNKKYKDSESTACCSDCQFEINDCKDNCKYRWENCPYIEKCLGCKGYKEKIEVKVKRKEERKRKTKNKAKQRKEVI